MIATPLFRPASTLVAAAVLCMTATLAAAEDSPDVMALLDDTISIWVGGFFPEIDSHIRLDSGQNLPGDTIDFEETLNLEDGKNVWFGGVRWRISDRHTLEFEAARLHRSGRVEAITEDLNIGDYEARIGARIDTTFDVSLGRLTYGYHAVKTRRSRLALKAGLHIARMDTRLDLSGNVFVDGQPIDDPATGVLEVVEFTYPLPHFGASYTYMLSPKLALRAQGLGFALEFKGYKGTLLDLSTDLVYSPWRQFGIGAGVRYFRASLEDTSDAKLRGKFIYEYYGPVVYGTVSF